MSSVLAASKNAGLKIHYMKQTCPKDVYNGPTVDYGLR